MKKELIKALGDSFNKLGMESFHSIDVEVPPREELGDLSTPVAMTLAKTLKKPPRKIAEELLTVLKNNIVFDKAEIAGPGFLNVTFSKAYLLLELKKLIRDKEIVLRDDIGKGRKVQIEFISANPTGPLHLGHGRGGATGAALANLLAAAGYKVEKEYYINDAGRQVKLLGLSVFARYQQLLGQQFPFPEDGYRGEYVEEIANSIIAENGGKYLAMEFPDVSEFFIDFSYEMMLSGIREDLNHFGVVFDTWQSERELFKSGDVVKAIEDLRGKGYIYEKDGAIWFQSTAFGDDKDRVVIKQDGEYTYFASDIAYHRNKIGRHFDELITIWGADHHGYIPRVKAVLSALGYPAEKLRVLLVQMVALLRGGTPVQMSKRSGDFVTLSEITDEVGTDITKFIFLTRRFDSHLEFDIEAAKAQSSENPVFYVQYANARINSIFAHAREKMINTGNPDTADLSLLALAEEMRIIKKLLFYPMIFEGAVNACEPHRITFYLQELSGLFHPYYNKHRIITEDSELSRARLALCDAIRIVLREGLGLLGVTAPDKM